MTRSLGSLRRGTDAATRAAARATGVAGRTTWTALALLLAMPAHAANDAGTQSVFAYGAGNRAAAMGAAFVAAVDDASAMVWNPAGLGLVPRAELQAVQSGDLGLGMSE